MIILFLISLSKKIYFIEKIFNMSAESGPSVSSAFVHPGQSDQIWGIFIPYDCYLKAFFEILKVTLIYWLLSHRNS
jgi:hypothetical protein